MTATTRLLASIAVACLLAGLTACAPSPGSPQPTALPGPIPSKTEQAAPVAPELTFIQPELCSAALPASSLAEFASMGYELLGGPDGKYGDEYLLDETPEQQAGGITCIWGDDSTEQSAITISVAPVTAETRATLFGVLSNQGLLQQGAETDATVTFGQLGDEQTEPAIHNILRQDSWISVIITRGGEAAYDDAIAYAEDVALTVYR